jgi:hypothetical protein
MSQQDQAQAQQAKQDLPTTKPAGPAPETASPASNAARSRAAGLVRGWARHPVVLHLAVLVGYIALGILLTWPRASYLAGRLPDTRDAASYVWGFWWMAHSVAHLTNPWSTTMLAAPVGTQLGLHTLMPLPGVLLAPVTILFGPSASYNLLAIALPGLLSYAMYRVARLFLPSQISAIAAGGFFGYSVIVVFWTWNHVNLAAGALCVPIAVEAAVRLRRRPGLLQAGVLGLVLGASVLVDQDSALMAGLAAGAAALPLLFARRAPAEAGDRSIAARMLSAPRWARLLPLGFAVAVAAVVATPQILAIQNEIAVGGPPVPPDAGSYLGGTTIPTVFEPSPRVGQLGLHIPHSPVFVTYGAVLTILAVLGLVLTWRSRTARWLALAWLGAAALALGSSLRIGHASYFPVAQVWHDVRLSSVLPFTWLVRIPGLASFRVPARFAEVGLVPAALLAGFAVDWIRRNARVALIGVFALALLEAGLSTPAGQKSMPTTLPALDRPITADTSHSIVVDLPFGLRGGVGLRGSAFAPECEVIATSDGHPLAVATLSRVPPATAKGIRNQLFYADLMTIQRGHTSFTAANLVLAAQNASNMHVGWVLVWAGEHHVRPFLLATGFRFAYRAHGVAVYRPASDVRR